MYIVLVRACLYEAGLFVLRYVFRALTTTASSACIRQSGAGSRPAMNVVSTSVHGTRTHEHRSCAVYLLRACVMKCVCVCECVRVCAVRAWKCLYWNSWTSCAPARTTQQLPTEPHYNLNLTVLKYGNIAASCVHQAVMFELLCHMIGATAVKHDAVVDIWPCVGDAGCCVG